MDPNTTLNIALDRARYVLDRSEQHPDDLESVPEASELAQAVLDLHEWLAKGGFLPAQWKKAR